MMSREVYVVDKRKDKSGWWVILLAAVLIAYWKVILWGCLFAAIAYATYKAYQAYQRLVAEHEMYNAAIAARADYENAEYLANGIIEGQYPAATMPISERFTYQPIYYDHDDGLKDWK
jgi:hypothetical protein